MTGTRPPILHVAALPFPTVQGTQAAIASMLGASAEAGRSTHLLAYAHGASPVKAPYAVHRLADVPRFRSHRSGPSWRKVALDAQLVWAVHRTKTRLEARWVVAHHVEAAAAARLAGARPFAFVAHTDLGEELPTYAPPFMGSVLRSSGAALDRALLREADAVLAVSPLLAHRLTQAHGRPVQYLPIPWPIHEPISTDARTTARKGYGLREEDAVVLYAGNLDAYQGVEDIVWACSLVARTRPELRLLVATESTAIALHRLCAAAMIEAHLRVVPLATPNARRTAYEAADVAVVPRRAPGGIPVKLLEALAHGVPTVASRRACAGLPVDRVVHVVEDDDPWAMAGGLRDALRGLRSGRTPEAHAYLRDQHAPHRFLAVLDAATFGGAQEMGRQTPASLLTVC